MGNLFDLYLEQSFNKVLNGTNPPLIGNVRLDTCMHIFQTKTSSVIAAGKCIRDCRQSSCKEVKVILCLGDASILIYKIYLGPVNLILPSQFSVSTKIA